MQILARIFKMAQMMRAVVPVHQATYYRVSGVATSAFYILNNSTEKSNKNPNVFNSWAQTFSK
jgi:hypothetical protein